MAHEVLLPELGEGLEGGEVVDVKVAEGAVVGKGQPLLELEAEKSTFPVPAPVSGRVSKVHVNKGDTVKVGQPICAIEETDGAAAETKAAAAPPPERAAPPQAPAKAAERRPEPPPIPKPDGVETVVPAGPATRRLARELGVDLGRVEGSGRDGRVTEDDVRGFVRRLASGEGAPAAGAPQAPPLPEFESWGAVERQALDKVRRITAQRLSLAWSLIPHVTQHDVADITDLEAFRKRQDGKGPKLTMTAFALKACAVALKRFPKFNASLDQAGNALVLKRYYHLGVAVDTERGLLVPVLRDVDKKSVQDLAAELAEVSEKARQGQADMSGGTFTISNLGGIGGTGFTPIVNWPEVAILGLSRGRLQPVVRDGQVVPRLLLPLSLSYDHRVIDGAEAARFARFVAEMLEDPWAMVLHA